MKRNLGFFVLALAMALPLAAEGLGELFQKAKEQVKGAHWEDALKTLDALDGASKEPGLEAQRKQLEPALAFYRAVCFANSDRPADAQAQFETYLAFNPNASLDRAMYSKKAVDAFERAQKKMGGAGSSGATSLAAAYRDFRMTDGATTTDPPKENWAEGPARVLLTTEEKKEYSGLSDAMSRSEFITKFWAARDPKPETPENEFRQDFEKRIAFSDRNFTQDETRGSLTDRGLVFLLLGPPTYAGRSPISIGDDSAEQQGVSSVGRHDAEVAVANARGSSGGKLSTGKTSSIVGQSSGAGKSVSEAANNWREIWHYRRELLPSGIGYQQVDFEFITRKGYGTNVLQRDSPALTTLDAARQKLRAPAGKSS